MIVVDASVLANVIADDGPDGQAARACVRSAAYLMAPDLVDVETVSVLRRRWLAKDLTAPRFRAALHRHGLRRRVRRPRRGTCVPAGDRR